MARTSSLFGTERTSTSRPTGTIMAPPRPWKTRASTNCGKESLIPQRIEPIVKITMAARNTVRAPKRSATQPLMGMNTARLKR